MNAEERVNAEIKAAMLAKDQKRLEALRAIKSAILLLKTSPEGYSDESVSKTIQKEVKKRKESAEIYRAQNRPDLEEVELFQAKVMEEYLPKQMSESELRDALRRIIETAGAKGPGDIGKVMGAASKAFAGKADNRMVSTLAKELLGG
jgi:uncharacterized protein